MVVEDKALHTAGDQVLRVVSLANAYVHREKERKGEKRREKKRSPCKAKRGNN